MEDLLPLPAIDEIYRRLALAIGLGFVVGLERGWRNRDHSPGTSAAGVRTFALMGFLGGLTGLLGTIAGDGLTIAFSLGFFAFVVATYLVEMRPTAGRIPDKGMTTEVAALVTFLLGLLAVRGDMTLVSVSAVVLVAVLNLKEPLHAALKQLKEFELQAAIKLLLISVLVLPFLPNKGYGPAGIWNPFELWWMVVLIAGISFGGYFAIRIVGTKTGPLIMGVLGGLASSTALTVAAARFVARLPQAQDGFAGAVAISAAVSFLRTLLLANIFSEDVGRLLIGPMLAAGLVCVLGALFLNNRAMSDKGSDVMASEMGTPDDFGTAFKFGLVLFGVITLAHYATLWLGPEGLYSVAAVSGLVDVDAVTLSVSRLEEGAGAVSPDVAALAIMIAILVNSGVKIAYGYYFAGRGFAFRLAPLFLVAGGAGFGAFVAI
ncbi:MAG: MgtC/SapB family protein [Parvibaculum sp.]